MKTLHRPLFLLLVVGTALTTASFAQEPSQRGGEGHQQQRRGGGPMGAPQARLDRLSSQLNLTDEQKTRILPMLEQESTQMKSLRESSDGPSPEMFSKMREIHQGTSAQIRAVLASDQQAKFDKMQNEEEQRRKERMSGRGPGHGDDDSKPNDGGAPPAPPQRD